MNTNQIYRETTADIFGDVIHRYTRAQAIDDGMLIDFTDPESDTGDVCRQHYKFPIACTSAVFDIMQKAVENPRYCQDYAGILHDMLFMSKVMKRKLDESTVIFRVIIAGAGGAAHLPGMVASLTTLPVVGVPVAATSLDGLDSLFSIVQMPKGVPVATVAIGNARNAGLLAVQILAIADADLADRLQMFREDQTAMIVEKDRLTARGSD